MKKILIPVFFFVLAFVAYLYEWVDTWTFILQLLYALIAYYLSVFAKDSSNVFLALILSVIWFFFYPNTFYLVTETSDFHVVNNIYENGLDMLNFTVRMGALFYGMFCGVLSFQNIASRFKFNVNMRVSVIVVLSLITSILIFSVGSDINSWQWVTNPLTFSYIFDGFVIDTRTMPFIFGFTALQVMCQLLADKEEA